MEIAPAVPTPSQGEEEGATLAASFQQADFVPLSSSSSPSLLAVNNILGVSWFDEDDEERMFAGSAGTLVTPKILSGTNALAAAVSSLFIKIVSFSGSITAILSSRVWQLYFGNLVKAEEGMYFSQPGTGVGDSLVPATVCAFVKEHYSIFGAENVLDELIELLAL